MKQAFDRPGKVGSLREEAKVMKGLEHQNIIKYQDGFTLDRNYYLVLELADLGDLKDRINAQKTSKAGRWSKDVMQYIFFQILSGMKYLHHKRIWHRDLKPANILISFGNDGCVVLKIADFGLAKETEVTSAYAHSRIGTRVYMSPELLKRNDDTHVIQYKADCDIWALGCVLYELWYLHQNQIAQMSPKSF